MEENGRSNTFGNSDRRQNINHGQELFPRPLKTRSGFDDMMGSALTSLHTIPLHHTDKFNSWVSLNIHRRNIFKNSLYLKC